MPGLGDIVITGIGCVTAIGIGRDEFWSGLKVGQCAIQQLDYFGSDSDRIVLGAPLRDFDPKAYVTPRKALKVMSREVQAAYSAAHLAWKDAGINELATDPDRVGVIFGSEVIAGDFDDLTAAVTSSTTKNEMDFGKWGSLGMKEIFPLWMLKNLPNMPACHVGIAIDARGPSNSIVQEEVSGLNALMEAVSIVERGVADLMVVGATGSRVNPTRVLYRFPELYPQNNPSSALGAIAFDRRRIGVIPGEGAVALIVESRAHAQRRGADMIARVLGSANVYCRPLMTRCGSSRAISLAIRNAMSDAGIEAADLDHVSAQGFSHPQLDIEEATAIRAVLRDVPTTALSGNLGMLGASGGLIELAACALALQHRVHLPIIGYEQPDSACPVNVIRDFDSSTRAVCSKDQFYSSRPSVGGRYRMHDLNSLVIVVDQESPCPYIEGNVARMPLEVSNDHLKPTEVDHLLARGYRRSGWFYYHTNCPHCHACEPLRLDVGKFQESKSLKRVRRRGDEVLEVRVGEPKSDSLRLELFNRHRIERNLSKSFDLATDVDYESFLVESAIEVWELSFWLEERLIAVSITDAGSESLSAVYCYFDPDFDYLSLGTYAILTQIALAKETGRRWLYLGMYVASNDHLKYKARFRPHQRFQQKRWIVYS